MPSSKHTFMVTALKSRLDKYLAEVLHDVSRSSIQRTIEVGSVTVNGTVVTESKFVVRRGDTIVYEQPEVEEALVPTDLPLTVLYDNHGLLIVDKPAGLPAHPGAGFKGSSLASALLFHYKDIAGVGEAHRPGIVHRLDKDTSGVMLVARTQEMYEYLKDAFSERKVRKEYIALVEGRLEPGQGRMDAAIGKSKTDFRKQTTKDPMDPKPALTEYQVIERLHSPIDEYALCTVQLHTGRTHQIRVHFSSHGFPLAGDTLYGKKKISLPHLTRQFLHAKRIEVRLPDGTWIEAESKLPSDLRNVLKELGSKTVIGL